MLTRSRQVLKLVTYLLLILVLPVAAQDVDTAAKSSIIPEALLSQVAAGDAEAAYFIGKLFKEGLENEFQSIEADPKMAHEWFLKAAELGYVHAMYEAARYLYRDKQWAAAEKWLQQAADNGHAESFYKLAYYAVYGLNETPKDCHVAYDKFEQAIIRGVRAASNDMAWMLSTLPEDNCRNGHRALKIFSDLESSYGQQGRMPWAMIDTKAAVLAEIANYNGAVELQSWVVAGYCNMTISELDDFSLILEQYQADNPEQKNSRCEGFIKRLQTYVARKPWREPMELSNESE